MRKTIAVPILIIFIFSSFAYAESSLGTFTVSNLAPPTPFDWEPFVTHFKTQNFTWNESIDQNGQEIFTYVCVTNDTDSDNCDVVNEYYTNESWYKFNLTETFWDYDVFGTANRTYYVRLTPNDGDINGTANDTISFKLEDEIPTLSGEVSDVGGSVCDIDYDEMASLSFTATSADQESDNTSFIVCSTDGINSTGGCTGTEICSEDFSSSTERGCDNIGLSAPVTGIGQTAYAFVCDCVTGDDECPSTCEPTGYSISYSVNQVPGTPTSATAVGAGSGTIDATCSADDAGYGSGDTGDASTGSLSYDWDQAGCSGSTCGNANFVACETLTCNAVATDDCLVSGGIAYSNTITVTNTAPAIEHVWFQDGATDFDLLTDNNSETHDDTPVFFVQITDPDLIDGSGQNVSVRINISDSAPGDDNYGSTISDSPVLGNDGNATVTTTSYLDYDGLKKLYYISVEVYDNATCGNAEGTTVFYEFNLTNELPYLQSINITATHDNPVDIAWVINDSDNGDADYWPADDTWEYNVSIIDAVNGTTYCSFLNNTLIKSNNITTCSLPWGDVAAGDYANRTLTFRASLQDRFASGDNHTQGSDALAIDDASLEFNFTLYDYLPNVINVLMTDTGAYSSCTTSECALNPVSGGNSTIAVKLNISDSDNDCGSTSIDPIFHLCINDSLCNNTMSDFSWTVDSVEDNGDSCVYTFVTNKTANDTTPEFWQLPSTSYLFYVEITSQALLERPLDDERNQSWTYNALQSIDYPETVLLGDGILDLGTWNNGTALATLTNYGNLILNFTWDSTNPDSGSDIWNLNNTDLRLDDDVQYVEDAGLGIGLDYMYLNGTANYFFPSATGLELCISDACGNDALNETLSTYYHAYPPEGLLAGQYNSTITITLYNHS